MEKRMFEDLLRYNEPEDNSEDTVEVEEIQSVGTPEERRKDLSIQKKTFITVDTYPIISRIIKWTLLTLTVISLVFFVHKGLELSIGDRYWELFQ